MRTTIEGLVYLKRILYHFKQLLIRFSLTALLFGPVIWSKDDINHTNTIWQCKEYTANDLLVADCSNQGKEIYVPSNLNPETQVLNLSGNLMSECTAQSFERYQHSLIVLDLSDSHKINMNYNKDCFSLLTNLQILNISRTCFPPPISDNDYRFPLPSSIRIFVYEYCTDEYVDFSALLNLEEFHARGTNLYSFPVFAPLIPLKYVDLRGNDLTIFVLSMISSLCTMQEMLLEVPEGQGIQEHLQFCQCVRLNNWLTSIQIKYNRLNCTDNKTMRNVCNYQEDLEESKHDREECLKTFTTGEGVSTTFIWILIGMALLVLLISISVMYFWQRRRTPRRTSARKQRQLVGSTTSGPPTQRGEIETQEEIAPQSEDTQPEDVD